MFIWSVRSVWFVWLQETNQMNQMNQIDQTDRVYCSLLVVRDPFLTVRLVQMIEDVVGFRQHLISILKDRDIVLT